MKSEKWRGDKAGMYYYITFALTIAATWDAFITFDNDCYNSGNYFQTKEEAEIVLAKFKQVLNDFHKSKLESK